MGKSMLGRFKIRYFNDMGMGSSAAQQAAMVKPVPTTKGARFRGNMIDTVHKAKPGCSSCGKRG